VDELRWQGPKPGFSTLGARLDAAVTARLPPQPKEKG
jgi:hypothetical protein